MYAPAVIAEEYAWSKYTIHMELISIFTSNCFDMHNKSLVSDIKKIDRLINF